MNDAGYVHRHRSIEKRQRGDDCYTPGDLCTVDTCYEDRMDGSVYCEAHALFQNLKPSSDGGGTVSINTTNNNPSRTESIYDHIKINIEQSSKGARVTVTYDRSDHDIDRAVEDAILSYVKTIKNLKEQDMKVDE